jgi:hypothetical protein
LLQISGYRPRHVPDARFGFRFACAKVEFAWFLCLVPAVVEGPDSVSFRSHKLTIFVSSFRAMAGLPALEPPAESDVLVAAQQLMTLKNEHPARDKAETGASGATASTSSSSPLPCPDLPEYAPSWEPRPESEWRRRSRHHRSQRRSKQKERRSKSTYVYAPRLYIQQFNVPVCGSWNSVKLNR